MSHLIRLAIVDQDAQFRLAICRFLKSVGDISVVGEASDGQEALALVRSSQPDIVLLDLETLQTSGLQVVAQVGQQFPAVKIIVLNTSGQEPMVLDALRKGALGHMAKSPTRPGEIVAAIRAASRDEAVLSPEIAGQILDDIASHPHDPHHPHH